MMAGSAVVVACALGGGGRPVVANRSNLYAQTHTHAHAGGMIEKLSNGTDTDKSVSSGLAAPYRHEN